MNIWIYAIPHKLQRYDTVGDWWFAHNGDLRITVSALGDWRYELLIAFHELAEALLCKNRGITHTEVTAFDLLFEEERAAGKCAADAEAGDDPRAPYRREHAFATMVERLLAGELGVDWAEYENAIEGLLANDGKPDHEKLSREFMARFPNIRKRLADS